MPNRARGAGRDVCGVSTELTAWAVYSSTVLSTAPVPSWPPMTKTRDETPRSTAAAPWLRRSVSPPGLNPVQAPAPSGSAWKRWTGFGLATEGAASEPVLPETTWMSSRGSAVLIPPATVIPNWATAVGSEATVRQVLVAGLYSCTILAGSAVGDVLR